MTQIDIFSGFLGAGKTTLIRKLIQEAYQGEKLVMFTSIVDGFRHIDVFKKHGINLDTYLSFFDNFTAKVTENYKKTATINGDEVEQGVYNIELRKINAYSWKDIGRKYKLENDNIEKGIDAWHM